jgi:ribosomal protein S27AE
MAKKDKMICPKCGIEMNHHAEKIDYSFAPDEADAAGSDFGGALQEIHSCPECGQTKTRRAD